MTTTFTYWKEPDGRYLGHLNSHPDRWTQSDNLEDLKEHPRDLYEMFSAEDTPGIRKVEAIEVAGSATTLSPNLSTSDAPCCATAPDTTSAISQRVADLSQCRDIAR